MVSDDTKNAMGKRASRASMAWAVRRAASCVIVGLSLWTTAAYAESTPTDRETARVLMDEGDAKFDRKDYTGALQAYRAAHAIMNVPTTGFAVAQAFAELGQLIEARDAAILVTRIPAAPHEPAPFTKARAHAEKLAADLAPRIGALRIVVEGPTENADLRLEVDGAHVPSAMLNLLRSANPGAHVVRASAAGYSDDEKKVTVGKGQTVEVKLMLHAKSALPSAATPLATSSAAAKVEHPSPDRSESKGVTAGSTQRIGALVVAGIGVAGMATGGVLALAAKDKYDSAPNCDATGCDDDGVAERNAARKQGDIASVVFCVGAVAVAGAAVLWFTAPRPLAPSVGIAPSRVVFRMSF